MSLSTEAPTPAGSDWTYEPTTLEENPFKDITIIDSRIEDTDDDNIVDDDDDLIDDDILDDDDFPDTLEPTEAPTITETDDPSEKPSSMPTFSPTIATTLPPTVLPTNIPPTSKPTIAPTIPPTSKAQGASATVKGTVVSSGHDIGFQSNWGYKKSTYAGSMQYDFTRHSIYLTGITYEDNIDTSTTKSNLPRSSCFVGQIPIANLQQWKTFQSPLPPRTVNKDFIIPDSFNDKEQMGCSAILYDSSVSSASVSSSSDYLYVGGVDETDMSSRESSITGFINVYERARAYPEWTNINIQSKELQNPTKDLDPDPVIAKEQQQSNTIPIRYPIAMAYGVDSGNSPEIAVISISSYDALLTDTFIENNDKNNPQNLKNSLLPPGIGSKSNPNKYDYYKRGSNFFITFQRFKLDNDTGNGVQPPQIVFTVGVDLISSRPETSTIMPTGLINLNPNGKTYEIAGSYKGSPPREWRGFQPTSTVDSIYNDHYDGFVAGIRYPQTRPTWETTIRFSSIEINPQLDDYIHDICDGGVDDKAFYVIGSSQGTMPTGTLQPDNSNTTTSTNTNPEVKLKNDNTLSGWVSKIDSVTRTVLWTTQIYGSDHTEAFGCQVIPDDPSLMYIGGTVYNNGEIMYISHGPNAAVSQSIPKSDSSSAGQDDVWVAQLDTTIGSLIWVKQLGSSGNDRISRTNGVQADIEGDCIIYGDTNGELYRTKNTDEINAEYSDIFLVKLDKMDGSYTSTIENDRVQQQKVNQKKHSTVIGIAGGAFILLSLCMCCCIFYNNKCQRPRRRRRRNNKLDANGDLASDGIFTDAMYRDDAEDNFDSNNNGDIDLTIVSSSYSDNVQQPPSHPNGTLESNMKGPPNQSAFKDDPDFRPGRNFV